MTHRFVSPHLLIDGQYQCCGRTSTHTNDCGISSGTSSQIMVTIVIVHMFTVRLVSGVHLRWLTADNRTFIFNSVCVDGDTIFIRSPCINMSMLVLYIFFQIIVVHTSSFCWKKVCFVVNGFYFMCMIPMYDGNQSDCNFVIVGVWEFKLMHVWPCTQCYFYLR